MKRILYLSFLLSLLWGGGVAQAQLPGPCAGTIYPFMQICVPPAGQNPWLEEWKDFASKTDTHAAQTEAPHGATSTNIASRIVARNTTGGIAVSFVDGNVAGNATTSTSLVLNPTDCLGINFAKTIEANGNLGCSPISATDVSGVLPLTAGVSAPLTGPLYLDNLGIRGEASDTQEACTVGVYWITPDLSETQWKKCTNGVLSNIGVDAGASGDITSVWTATTGDVVALTAGATNTFDAGAAASSSPATRALTIPGACAEGRMMQDTDSGGSETFICTATGVATKLAATTDTAPLATALATLPQKCLAGNAPLGIVTNGDATDCYDIATQTELTTHTNDTTIAHGATAANTANTIVKRDAAGAILWKSPLFTVATLPVCTVAMAVTRASVSDGATTTPCTTGGGDSLAHCVCDGSGAGWILESSGSEGIDTIQSVYLNSGNTPTLTSGPNGLKQTGFNSLTKSNQLCNDGDVQCKYDWIDQSGKYFSTFKLPVTFATKLYAGESWQLLSSTGGLLLEMTNAGVVRGTARFLEKCNTQFGIDAADVNLPIASFQQPVTIKTVWCFYNAGTAPTTVATFRFEHGNGTALTYNALTCSAPGSITTPQTVTANGSFAAYELLRYDVTNTPNPATDYYTQCVSYVLD